jgi:hypothetical protein
VPPTLGSDGGPEREDISQDSPRVGLCASVCLSVCLSLSQSMEHRLGAALGLALCL